LSTLTRNWISAKHQAAELELKRLAADVTTAPQVIRVEGGLPPLPGTNITMPQLNGNTNGFDLLKDDTAFLKDVTEARQTQNPGELSPPAPLRANGFTFNPQTRTWVHDKDGHTIPAK
jgi:hypothetical protein